MNTATQFFQDWQALQVSLADLGLGWQAKELSPVQLDVTHQRLTAEQLRSHLDEIANSQGWVLQPSHRHILPVTLALLERQNLLQGEGVSAQGHWQLHYVGQNLWSWTNIRITESSADTATHFAEDVVFLSETHPSETLVYKRLWSGVFQTKTKPSIELAVFTGFGGAQP